MIMIITIGVITDHVCVSVFACMVLWKPVDKDPINVCSTRSRKPCIPRYMRGLGILIYNGISISTHTNTNIGIKVTALVVLCF